MAAGVLHDVIEDTEAEYDELERDFGAEVARLVCAVTEPSDDGSYSERKARLRRAVAEAETDAIVIFAADKVAKAREFRLNLVRRSERKPVRVDPAKLEHYWACLSLLEARLDGHAFVRQFRFELEALELLPPERGSRPARSAQAERRAIRAVHGKG